MPLTLAPLSACPAGALASLLEESYAALLEQVEEAEALALRANWGDFDAAVQQHPETVGACGFVTRLGDETIGFASWDPREWPMARVGHNCIRPGDRGRGHGAGQIEEVLRRLRARGFERVWARTSAHPFFEPARRMYRRCGFRLTEREQAARALGYETVAYEVLLHS